MNHLCERNVTAQVAAIAAGPFAEDAWRRGQPLPIHGWIYPIQGGLLRDLETSMHPPKAPARTRRAAASR